VPAAKRSLVDSVNKAFRADRAAFLSDSRYSYLADMSRARQRLRYLDEAMTGSWTLPQA